MVEEIIIQDGRPENTDGRIESEVKVYDVLDALGIAYKRADHKAAMTMEDCIAVDEALDIHAPKNLFLRNTQKTKFYLLVMPGDKKFKTKDLSHQLGIARLSFAEEEFMVELLGLHPGSVSVMGLMNDTEHKVTLLIDEDSYPDEYMGCHPCANTSSIKFKTKEFYEKFLTFVEHEPTFVKL